MLSEGHLIAVKFQRPSLIDGHALTGAQGTLSLNAQGTEVYDGRPTVRIGSQQDYLARSALGETGTKHGVAKNATEGDGGAEVSAHGQVRANGDATRVGNHTNVPCPAIGAGDAAHCAGVSLGRV